VSKRLLYALLLMAAMVIVLILNARGNATIDFRFFDLNASRAVVYFGFLSVGVAIGLLLK